MNRKTNVEVVTELMEFSKNGALQQAFILKAIEYYAQVCIKAGAKTFDNPMLSGEGWIRCAIEAREAIKEHLGS